MSFTNYTEAGVLQYVLAAQAGAGVSAFTQPTAVFVALYTEGPSETGGGVEVALATEGNVATPATPTGYARQPAQFTITAGNPTAAVNSGNIAFNTALAPFGTITHVGVTDTVTAGNLLAYAALQTPATVNTGDQFQIQTGNLRITLE